MLTELNIENYRGIRTAHVGDLAPINLFLGPNGSGKSTLLEAIFLSTREHTDSQFMFPDRSGQPLIAVRHNEAGFPNENMWFGKDLSKPISIEYCFGKGLYPYVISKGYQFRWVADPPNKEAFFSRLRLLDIRVLLSKSVEQGAWNELLKTRSDRDLSKLMNKVYRLNIESFSYVPDSQSLKVLFADRDYTLNIDDLGSGMRIAFRLFISVLLARESAVLVEEFDGYQHVDTFPKLVGALVSLSRSCSSQLFLATHSLDTVRTFAQEAQDAGEGSSLRVFQTSLAADGECKVSGLDASETLNLLEGGFDLRKVR